MMLKDTQINSQCFSLTKNTTKTLAAQHDEQHTPTQSPKLRVLLTFSAGVEFTSLSRPLVTLILIILINVFLMVEKFSREPTFNG